VTDSVDRRVRFRGRLEGREHLLGALGGQLCELCVRTEGVGCPVACPPGQRRTGPSSRRGRTGRTRPPERARQAPTRRRGVVFRL
jgi:hypothetical protein